MSKSESEVEDVQKDEEDSVASSQKKSSKSSAISKAEASYRNKRLKEIELTKEKIHCTSCKKNLMGTSSSHVERHPVLDVLLCKSCSDFYNDGEFSLDEDGTDKYCRWCGQGGTLFLCADCNLGFCRTCIKRNLNRATLASVQEEDWKCFKCNPEPLWELRALCEAVIRHMKERRERKQKSKGELKSFPKIKIRQRSSSKSSISSAASKTEKGKSNKRKVVESDSENEQTLKRSKKKSGSESETRSSKKKSGSKSEPRSSRRPSSQKGVKKDHKREYSEKKDEETVLDEKSADELCVQLKDNVSEVQKVISTVSEFLTKIHNDINVKNMIKYKRRHSLLEEIKKLGTLSVETINKAVGNIEIQYKGYIKNYEENTEKSESEKNLTGAEEGDKEKPKEDNGDSDSGSSKQLKAKKTSEDDPQDKTKGGASTQGPANDRPDVEEAADPMEVDEDSQEIRDVSLFCEPVINSEPEEVEDPVKDATSAGNETSKQEESCGVDTADKEDSEKQESEKKSDKKEHKNSETVKNVDVDHKDVKSEASKKEGNSSQTKEDAGGKDGCDGNGNCGTPPRLCPELDALDEQLELSSSGISSSLKPPTLQDESLSNSICAGTEESKSEDPDTNKKDSQQDGGGEKSNTKDSPNEEEKICSGDEGTRENDNKEILENGTINSSDDKKKKSGEISKSKKSDENDDKSEFDSTDCESNCVVEKKHGKKIERRESSDEKDDSSGESSGKLSGSLLAPSCGLAKKTKAKELDDIDSAAGGDASSSDIDKERSGKVEKTSSKENAECADEISGNHCKESAEDKMEKDTTSTTTTEELNSHKNHIKKEPAGILKNSSLGGSVDGTEHPSSENEAKDNEKAKAALLASSSDDERGEPEVIEESPEINSSSDEQLNKKKSPLLDIPDKDDRDSADVSESQTSKSKNLASVDSDSQDADDNKLLMKCAVNVKKLPGGSAKNTDPPLSSKENSDADEERTRKDVEKLVNLQTLKVKSKKKKASRLTVSDSDTDNKEAATDQRKKQLRKRKKKDSETLMDFLKKASEDSSDSENPSTAHNDLETTFAKLISNLEEKRNKMAETLLLGSSDSEAGEDESEEEKEKKKPKGKKKGSESAKVKKESESSDEKGNKKNKKWKSNKLLKMKLSETDTSEEERKFKAKKEKEEDKRRKKSSPRIFNSDSDVVTLSSSESSSSSSSSDSDVLFVPSKKKRKRRTDSSNAESKNSSDSGKSIKAKPKRSRIRKPISDSSDSDVKIESPKKGDPDTPSKSRKNIKKVMKDTNVEEATQKAAKEEEERRIRIAEKQKMYNMMYDLTQEKFDTLEKLVLDFDPETKKELVVVDKGLVERLKPHQAKGVKFMWDACFESLEQMKKSKGTGCILAHCMGLGKTFQVVTLVHTLLHHEEIDVRTVLVLAPMSTVLNWVNEFEKWCELAAENNIEVFELSKHKLNSERSFVLKNWQECGGVMVLGYEMFRSLTFGTGGKKKSAKTKETFERTLVDPGADLIICDEGHLLKNENSSLSKAVTRVKTMRRVVLTGTPLQNNLLEYHCMVQFVKPSLLGTRKEFSNRFVNPINNGQYEDSTQYDVKVMKKRAHVLHKMLEGCVQRFDYSVLTPFLPPKFEYALTVKLTDLQVKMYKHYLEQLRTESTDGKTRTTSLFKDFRQLQKVWTHPLTLKLDSAKQEHKRMFRDDDDDSEGSLRDFVVDSDSTTSSSSSSSSSEKACDNSKKRSTRQNGIIENEVVEVGSGNEKEEEDVREWWQKFMTKGTEMDDIRESGKLTLLFSLLAECEKIGDKVLLFSPSLLSLDMIEAFLCKIDESNQQGEPDEKLGGHMASWSVGLDYFRLDGTSSSENRAAWCKAFNREDNYRARLFLISTKAGGLGINLYGANRVIIFDASWNPSHDLQSIFRIYRFGQKKPCYIYRFLAQYTMEEKVYSRQVTKLSLACRVVDEQQIERHYSLEDLKEMYNFNPEEKNDHNTPMVPKDVLLAELLKGENSWIDTYHEHDSLLENKEEEELDEDERKAAWEEYEREKKGLINNYNQNPNLPTMSQLEIRQLYQSISTQNPGLSPQEVMSQVNVILQQLSNYLTVQNSQGVSNPYYQQMYAQMNGSDEFQQQVQKMHLQVQQQKQIRLQQQMQQQQMQQMQIQKQLQLQNQQQLQLARAPQGIQQPMASTSAVSQSNRIQVKSFGHIQNSNFAPPSSAILHNVLKEKMSEKLKMGNETPANKDNPDVVFLED